MILGKCLLIAAQPPIASLGKWDTSTSLRSRTEGRLNEITDFYIFSADSLSVECTFLHKIQVSIYPGRLNVSFIANDSPPDPSQGLLERPPIQPLHQQTLSNSVKMSHLDASKLFALNGLVAVVTGGGSGKSIHTFRTSATILTCHMQAWDEQWL